MKNRSKYYFSLIREKSELFCWRKKIPTESLVRRCSTKTHSYRMSHKFPLQQLYPHFNFLSLFQKKELLTTRSVSSAGHTHVSIINHCNITLLLPSRYPVTARDTKGTLPYYNGPFLVRSTPCCTWQSSQKEVKR